MIPQTHFLWHNVNYQESNVTFFFEDPIDK